MARIDYILAAPVGYATVVSWDYSLHLTGEFKMATQAIGITENSDFFYPNLVHLKKKWKFY